MITFTVWGNPKSKGSLQPFVNRKTGRALMVRSKSSAQWEQLVRTVAQTHRVEGCPWEGPIEMKITYYVKRPKTVKREFPTTKPDLDKLERAVFDGLTGIFFRDDSQVIANWHRKLYGTPRVEISVGCVND